MATFDGPKPMLMNAHINNRCKSPCKILEIIFVAISNFHFCLRSSDWLLRHWCARANTLSIRISYIEANEVDWQHVVDEAARAPGINEAIKLTKRSIWLPLKLWYMLCTRAADDGYSPSALLPVHLNSSSGPRRQPERSGRNVYENTSAWLLTSANSSQQNAGETPMSCVEKWQSMAYGVGCPAAPSPAVTNSLIQTMASRWV